MDTDEGEEGGVTRMPQAANGPCVRSSPRVAMALFFMAVGAQLVRLALMGVSAKLNLAQRDGCAELRASRHRRSQRPPAWLPTSKPTRCSPTRRASSTATRPSKSSPSCSPISTRNALRKELSDRNRRFIWVRRGLAPRTAQAVHNLGLPGFDFRRELRRAYPGGKLAGHVLGYVNIDNKGVAGIERYVDEVVGVEVRARRHARRAPARAPVDRHRRAARRRSRARRR